MKRTADPTKLTDRQRAIWRVMLQNSEIRYPTVRKVAKLCGITHSTAHQHIAALRKKGWLTEHKVSA